MEKMCRKLDFKVQYNKALLSESLAALALRKARRYVAKENEFMNYE